MTDVEIYLFAAPWVVTLAIGTGAFFLNRRDNREAEAARRAEQASAQSR